MLERLYQARLIKRLKMEFPNCIVLKNDTSYLQGIPDLLVLFEDSWAMLEVKPSHKFTFEPNQEYYIRVLAQMSFAAVICPENEDEVIDALQYTFSARRQARLS